MTFEERFSVYSQKVIPLLKKGVHYDNMPKSEVGELLSEGTKTSAGQQLAQVSRDMIKAFRSQENPLQNEKIADKLEELHKSVRKPRGKRGPQVKIENIKDDLASLKESLGVE